jgi:hypothetical protein
VKPICFMIIPDGKKATSAEPGTGVATINFATEPSECLDVRRLIHRAQPSNGFDRKILLQLQLAPVPRWIKRRTSRHSLGSVASQRRSSLARITCRRLLIPSAPEALKLIVATPVPGSAEVAFLPSGMIMKQIGFTWATPTAFLIASSVNDIAHVEP